jgi:hypothetical protein
MEVSSRGRNAFLTALGVLGAVTVVAIASRGSTSSGKAGTRRLSDTLLDILLSFYIVALVVGAIFFVYLLALRRRSLADAGLGPARRDWRSGLTLLLVLVLGLLAARRISTADFRGVPATLPQPPGAGVPTNDPNHQAYDPAFAWVPVSITLGLLALAALGVWWSARVRRRARGERGTLLADAVADAVDESLDDLRAESDPRRAVIAAYARLERVLAAYGLPRKTSEAPLEYLNRMLAELSVSPAAARRLTDLFERAKFSQHAVGPEMKEQAIDALETVRDNLAAARALAEQERLAAIAELRERAAG